MKAVKMSLDDKRKKVKEANSCFVCLKKGHSATMCKSDIKCSNCSRRHYSVMCTESSDSQSQIQTSPSCFDGESISLSIPVKPNKETILTKTMQVRVIDKNVEFADVRLLLDEGSQKSYISTKLAQKMTCPVNKTVHQQYSLFGKKE